MAAPTHTPDTPRLVREKRKARRGVAELLTMPAIEGGKVLPVPLNAPEATASRFMESWEKAKIKRYRFPREMSAGSERNTEKILAPWVRKRTVIMLPHTAISAAEILVP